MDISLVVLSVIAVLCAVGLLIDLAFRVNTMRGHFARLSASCAKLNEFIGELEKRLKDLAEEKQRHEAEVVKLTQKRDAVNQKIEHEKKRPGKLMYITAEQPVTQEDRLWVVTLRVTPNSRSNLAAMRWREDRLILIWSQSQSMAMKSVETRFASAGTVIAGFTYLLPGWMIDGDKPR